MSEVIKAVEQIGDAFDEFKGAQDRRMSEMQNRLEAIEALSDRPRATVGGDQFSRDQVEHLERFKSWLRRPTEGSVKRQLDEAQGEMETKSAREGKAVVVGAGATGGYAVPEILDSQIEARVRLLNPFRSLVRVVTVGSRDWKALVSTNDSTNGWVAEAGARNETTTSELVERAPTFGTLYSYPYATEEAMQDVFFDVAAWLVEEAADGFAAAEATAIVSGNGSARPTGFLNSTPVTTDDGSPQRAAGTLEYIPITSPSSPYTSTGITGDTLIDLSMSIKEKYLLDAGKVAWVMSRATAANVRKLKDSYGQYLWQSGIAVGQPNTLLGFPVSLTDSMPAPTAGSYPIAFGNWSRAYILADRVGTMRITHDDNISAPGYHKFYMRRVVGGCVYNHEAVKVAKLGIS
jgi:HK97 family phage major capsid protein